MADLESLLAISPADFEKLVSELFESMGYDVKVTGKPGDQGVDIRLTRGDEVSIAQCKKYRGTVGQPAIRDFYGTMQHEKVLRGYFVTSGMFSVAASTWAAGKPIVLVDGPELLTSMRNQSIEIPSNEEPSRAISRRDAPLASALRLAKKDRAKHGRILIDGPPPPGRDYKEVLEYARSILKLSKTDTKWADADDLTRSSKNESDVFGPRPTPLWILNWYEEQKGGVAFVNEFEHTSRAIQMAALDHQTDRPPVSEFSDKKVKPPNYILIATRWEGRMYKVVRVRFSIELLSSQIEWDMIPSFAQMEEAEARSKKKAETARREALEQRLAELDEQRKRIGLYCRKCRQWWPATEPESTCRKCSRPVRYDGVNKTFDTEESGVFGSRWREVPSDSAEPKRAKQGYFKKRKVSIKKEVAHEMK